MTEAATRIPPRPTPKGETSRKSKASVTKRARAAANDAGNRILEGVESNPVAVLAGGIALGLFAGALLPKTKRESELLGGLGARLNEGAVAAVRAAKTAGTAELAAAGLNRVNANDQINNLIDAAIRALATAGTAAKEAAVDPASVAKPARKPRARKPTASKTTKA